MGSTRIQKLFEPVSEGNDYRILKHTHADRKFRPEIAYFQQKGFTPHKGNKPGRDGLKNWRRRAHDQINIFHLQSCPHGTEHKTKERNKTPEVTAMQRLGAIGTQYTYTLDHLLNIQTFTLYGAQTCLVVRITGDDHHLMPALA